MLSRSRAAVAPAYLFLCLILGGSAQGIWQNMLLQLVGIVLIAWAALDKGEGRLTPSARGLLFMTMLFVAIVALQMIPLPAELWPHLGGRERLAEDYAVLGMAVPSEGISLTPAAGFNSILGIIPPLALACAMVRLKAYRPTLMTGALLAGTILGIALGALQVASSNGQDLSYWYIYPDTNAGKGVGFFANANHMATLLLIAIPFIAAMIVSARRASAQRYWAVSTVATGLALIILVGIALNGSLAGYGLAAPVLAASVVIILPSGSKLRLWLGALAVLFMVAAVSAVEFTPIGSSKIGEEAASSVQSRTEILTTTVRATRDFLPFGSGLGSFPAVYNLYEKPERVTDSYVVHAHNDYAEFALELGLAGIVLIILFLFWWLRGVWQAWRFAERGPFARAATIASAAVLVHSVVDFPLRTAAIAACFAMCLSLIADSRTAPPEEKAQLRRTRHVEFL